MSDDSYMWKQDKQGAVAKAAANWGESMNLTEEARREIRKLALSRQAHTQAAKEFAGTMPPSGIDWDLRCAIVEHATRTHMSPRLHKRIEREIGVMAQEFIVATGQMARFDAWVVDGE